jgi:Ca2+-binding RTX toxin-like protein
MAKRIALLAGLLTLVWAPSASASVAGFGTVDPDGLIYAADPGEVNRLTISRIGDMTVFEDNGATISPGQGCVGETPNRVRCTARGFVSVSLEDGADEATTDASLAAQPELFFVGMDGGAGNDTLRAGPAGTSLNGGAGSDVLEGGPRTSGIFAVEISGRSEPDQVPPQSPESDRVTCVEPGPGVSEPRAVDIDQLDEIAGPCPPPAVYGADTIVQDGTDGPDNLFGGRGPTRVFGRGGDDSIQSDTGDRADGGDGNDTLFGTGLLLGGVGDDRLSVGFGTDRGRADGGPGNDFITGAEGPDSIAGGSGTDRMSGRGGNDSIRARDGVRDTVRCGAGRDSVSADRGDNVSRDCERVRR